MSKSLSLWALLHNSLRIKNLRLLVNGWAAAVPMALSRHISSTSSPHPFLLLQPRNHSPENVSFRIFKFKTSSPSSPSCCCSGRRTHVNATKGKRKPRPSFLEQVQGKWSLRQPSMRQILPWQQQKPQQYRQEQGCLEEEEEEEGKEETSQTCGVLEAEPDIGTSPSVSFTSQSRVIVPPWVHGTRPTETLLGSKPKKVGISAGFVEDCKDNVVDAAVDRAEHAFMEVNSSSEMKEKTVNFDDVSAKLSGDGEKTRVLDVNATFHGTEELPGEFEDIEVPSGDNSSSIDLPWEAPEQDDGRRKKSHTELAERTLPEHELKRLRNVSLRMLERIKVGAAGITEDLVAAIHEKWKVDEVVKLKFEAPLSYKMKRTHEILESRTGGLVIWRSGSSIVLYRGMTYRLQCVQSFAKQNDINSLAHGEEGISDSIHNVGAKDFIQTTESYIPSAARYLKDLSQEELTDFSELNHLLDELGPRFKDWNGREPLPVDADLLPSIVPEYKPPLRLLPYGVRHCLRNKEMTIFRRLARTVPPHFALGRNRELQGLAKAMVKLWERSAIAKIAIKHGVLNTRNERMAEELKRLTGGTLLSRNKDYIVFYRGNDFLPPAVTETLKERRKLTLLQQDKEEQARLMASVLIEANAKTAKSPLVAGTLSETKAATSRWGSEPSREDVEEMMRDSVLARHALLVKHLENKLAYAKGKLKKAEKALVKVQEHMEPRDLPTDLETLSDEERFLFRKIGLSMKPYLFLGRRGVYDGTVENMHLHWKYRELVKIIVKRKSLAQVKHIAVSLEAESGGLLVSTDRTTKGHAIIVYRGKNYVQPQELRPKNLLTRRQALARSIELQRREALKHHIIDLEERIGLVKSELEEMKAGNHVNAERTLMLDDPSISDDEVEEDEDGVEGTRLEVLNGNNGEAYDDQI